MQPIRLKTMTGVAAAAMTASIIAGTIMPARAAPGWLFENPSGTLTPNNIIRLMQLPPDDYSQFAPYGSYMYESVILPPRTQVTLSQAPVVVIGGPLVRLRNFLFPYAPVAASAELAAPF
jgi:hypothetical protein